MSVLVILIFLALILFLWQISNLISIFSGSVYVKSRRDVINFALKKSGLKRNNVFYELGCGSGDVLIEAQKLGANSIGFEISPYYYLISYLRTLTTPNIEVRFSNVKNIDFENVDVVYCYLLPKLLKELAPKFLRERPKKIISIGFEIEGLPKGKIYYYRNHKIIIYSFSSRSV